MSRYQRLIRDHHDSRMAAKASLLLVPTVNEVNEISPAPPVCQMPPVVASAPAPFRTPPAAPVAFAPMPAPIDAPAGPLEPQLAAALGLDPALPWMHPPMVGREVAASRPPRGWNGVLPAGCCHRDLCAKLGPCPHAVARCGAAPVEPTEPELDPQLDMELDPEFAGPAIRPALTIRRMADVWGREPG